MKLEEQRQLISLRHCGEVSLERFGMTVFRGFENWRLRMQRSIMEVSAVEESRVALEAVLEGEDKKRASELGDGQAGVSICRNDEEKVTLLFLISRVERRVGVWGT